MRRCVFLVAFSIGCASATEDDVLTTRDSGTASDTTPSDDTGPAIDTGTDTAPSCVGKEGTTCTPGETRESKCGFCGTVKDTCDPDTCTWNPGTCMNEGCEPGKVETIDCATAGESKTRTCDTTCTWSDYSACALPSGWLSMALPPDGFAARSGAVTAWSGTEMIVFGGRGPISDTSTGVLADGAAYDPLKNTWRSIAAPPTEFSGGRELAASVFANGKLHIWGGQDGLYQKNGVSYDPATDTWKLWSASPLPTISGAPAVWSTTTNEVLIWSDGNGAHYDPAADKWTSMPTAPISSRAGHRAIWTGTKMIIWSGCPGGVSCVADGAAYDPSTKTWTKLADPPTALDGRYGYADALAGSKVIFWGGYGGFELGNQYKKTGGVYDPTANSWTMMSPTPDTALPNPGREGMAYWYTAGKLYVFGGFNLDGGPSALNTGASYDVATDTWSAMPAKDGPSGRADAQFVWTGDTAVIWGGTQLRGAADKYFRDGARFRP